MVLEENDSVLMRRLELSDNDDEASNEADHEEIIPKLNQSKHFEEPDQSKNQSPVGQS